MANCCNREVMGWAAGTTSYRSNDVQSVMLKAVEIRLKPSPDKAFSDSVCDSKHCHRRKNDVKTNGFISL